MYPTYNMYSDARRARECARPVFGLWSAPLSPPATSEERAQIEQGHNKGRHLTKTPNSTVHSLHQALLSAQDTIKQLTRDNVSLREENARLTLKELSDHEALQELTSLYTQAKKEKEEVEAKVKQMEEDFQKEKSSWEDLSRSQLEEMNSFRKKWLAAQSHNQQLEEEVRKSTQELSECRRQVDRNITCVEDILCRQRQETAARISTMDGYWREVVRVREDCAAIKLRESEEKCQRMSQLEEEVAEKTRLIHSLTNNKMTKSDFYQHDTRWESKLNALEEKYRRALCEKEESWQKRVQEIERTNELGRTWLQKEAEWRQRTDALQDEIQRLNKELQGLNSKKKKRKQWWKRRWTFGRRRIQRRNTEAESEETASLLL